MDCDSLDSSAVIEDIHETIIYAFAGLGLALVVVVGLLAVFG